MDESDLGCELAKAGFTNKTIHKMAYDVLDSGMWKSIDVLYLGGETKYTNLAPILERVRKAREGH